MKTTASGVPITKHPATDGVKIDNVRTLQRVAGSLEADPTDAASILMTAALATIAENYPADAAMRLAEAISRDTPSGMREALQARA